MSPPPSDLDHGETCYYTRPLVGIHRSRRPARAPPSSLSAFGQRPRPPPKAAPSVLYLALLRLAIDWFDLTTTHKFHSTKYHYTLSPVHQFHEPRYPLTKMSLNQLSQFGYASEANVFVTAASLLANGNVEILEIHIFDRERMGVLVSTHLDVSFSDRVSWR